MTDDYDIIIIGAGIAGSSCAVLCARAGLSVLLLERGERPGNKNLSGGRLYGYALRELIPDFAEHAPLERHIHREHISLLSYASSTTFSSQLARADSWSVLRARFDPWLADQAQNAGAQLLTQATVQALHLQDGTVCGVVCDGEIITSRFVVLAEGANSMLAQQHGLVPRPAQTSMATGIKEVLTLDRATLEERFQLEENQGVAWLFTGGVCGSRPGGAFLYTNRDTISFGVVCPLSSLSATQPATTLLSQVKAHPTLRPLLRGCSSVEYGAHLVPEGGLNAMPVQKGGDGWLLIGDALGSCVNTGFTVRGMDLAVLNAQAAARTLIAASQKSGSQLFPDYHRQLERSALWAILQRYQSLPALLQRPGWYQRWPDFCRDVSEALWRADHTPTPPLWQLLWQHGRRHGLSHMVADMLRSLRCL
ncbi:FAD-dependent oxidoreductase [Enterobacter sp. ENT03]|uniref:FAD-dependent oxidoreductase n=1 Tax=Enterobacter sp. ENT03 TaxID=2854780 RepID=UPI001C483495|nr:FAD-dependent oxidoreductase [Enterobacter sp. ENT03]MBV7404204.1 FAD-dependent oxidoreductase [Enterobacter sp. ENT03]